MIEHLPFLAEDIRNLISFVETTLSELAKLKPKIKAEALFRKKIISSLETASSALIDTYQLLSDAQACSDDGNLEQVLEESEVEQ